MYNFNMNGLDARNYVFYSLLIVLSLVLVIIARVFFMLAVGEDAKAIGVKSRTMWMVLTFFFPVAGLIYLGVRSSTEKTVPRMCANCGATMPPNTKICMNCSSPMLLDYRITDEERFKRSRKIFLIAGIVFYIVGFLIFQCSTAFIAQQAVKDYSRNNQGDYNYGDYFDNFGSDNNGGYEIDPFDFFNDFD